MSRNQVSQPVVQLSAVVLEGRILALVYKEGFTCSRSKARREDISRRPAQSKTQPQKPHVLQSFSDMLKKRR
jgi:hypothetical protein